MGEKERMSSEGREDMAPIIRHAADDRKCAGALHPQSHGRAAQQDDLKHDEVEPEHHDQVSGQGDDQGSSPRRRAKADCQRQDQGKDRQRQCRIQHAQIVFIENDVDMRQAPGCQDAKW